MKISTILAAIGMIAATVGTVGTADAQRRDDNRGRYEQRGPRGGHHDVRRDRGRHYGRDRHQRCRTVIRHNRRVRVCR